MLRCCKRKQPFFKWTCLPKSHDARRSDGNPICRMDTSSPYHYMVGRLHLRLVDTYTLDGFIFHDNTKINIEKLLFYAVLRYFMEHVCLDYRSTEDYDYNCNIDWSNLIAILTYPILLRQNTPKERRRKIGERRLYCLGWMIG